LAALRTPWHVGTYNSAINVLADMQCVRRLFLPVGGGTAACDFIHTLFILGTDDIHTLRGGVGMHAVFAVASRRSSLHYFTM